MSHNLPLSPIASQNLPIREEEKEKKEKTIH